jgi:two-component system cell cycle response regulator CtrA
MNLEDRCLMLEEENQQLRNAMRIPDKARYPAKWRLNGAESRVLSSLINAPAGFRTREALLDAARRWDDYNTGKGLLCVVMCTLRKKLKPFGIQIDTVHGEGYKISEEDTGKVIGARTKEVAR